VCGACASEQAVMWTPARGHSPAPAAAAG
jgi:hypothetical protein